MLHQEIMPDQSPAAEVGQAHPAYIRPVHLMNLSSPPPTYRKRTTGGVLEVDPPEGASVGQHATGAVAGAWAGWTASP